jgi:hypothetical protein
MPKSKKLSKSAQDELDYYENQSKNSSYNRYLAKVKKMTSPSYAGSDVPADPDPSVSSASRKGMNYFHEDDGK